MDTEVSDHSNTVESGAAEARGTHFLGERGGILPGRLAARFCVT